VFSIYIEGNSPERNKQNHPMKTDEKRIKIKGRASTALKANSIMENLFGVLVGIPDMASKEKAALLRQVASIASNYAQDIESFN